MTIAEQTNTKLIQFEKPTAVTYKPRFDRGPLLFTGSTPGDWR
jgi:hypothetical protein